MSESIISSPDKAADVLCREVVQSADIIILSFNREGKINFLNNYAQRFFGYKMDEIAGKSIIGTLVPEKETTGRDLAKLMQDLLASPQNYPVNENENIRSNGERVWIAWTNRAIYDDQGQMSQILSIGIDITTRKRAEEAQARLSALVESSDDAIIGKTLDGVILSWNDGACRIYGYTPDEVVGKNISILVPPGHPNELPHILDTIRQGKHVDHYETERVTKDGRHIIISLTVSPVKDKSGKIIGASTIARDITEKKLLEEEQKRQAEMLQEQAHMLDYAQVLVRDLDNVIIFWNKGAEIFYGWSKSEAIGQVSHNLFRTIFPEPLKNIREQLSRTGEWEGELRQHRKSGEQVTVASRWVLHKDTEGNPRAIIETNSDITNLKRAENELRILNAELEQRVAQRTMELEASVKELEAFSYSVSHDLRTPLRAMDGFSSALIRYYSDTLDDRGKDYLNRVRAAAQRMGQLIDDILMLSRASRAEMQRQKVDMSTMAAEVLDENKKSQPERHAQIEIEPNVVANADPHLLRIVMANLLGNAWKFTANRDVAQIELRVFRKDNERVYAVRDNGAGFDMAYADKLFTPFQRLHTDEEFPGTGIGLALVQRIIRRHGGRIWAESAVDKGSTFYFTLGEQD